eukprot:s694_g14.t1
MGDIGLGDTAVLLLSSAAWACGFGVVHYVLRLTAVLLQNENRKDQHEWANYVISCTQAAISGFAGAMGLLIEEPFATSFRRVCMFDAPIDTVHGRSLILQTAMPTILGYFVYDLALACLVSETSMERLITIHHILCVVVWPISYHYQAGCFYLLYMMAAELSTPFLWLVVYFLPRYRVTGPLYIFMGLVMVLVFFVIRVLPGPALLNSLISSQSYWKDVNTPVYALAMVTLPLPSLLFTYWFVRILQGMVGALAGPEKKEA